MYDWRKMKPQEREWILEVRRSRWPWSSAAEFLAQVGRERAQELWEEYPILDYGKKWDI